MIKSQIIIAGAGPVGTFIAFCLAEQGIDVLVLESAEHCETDMRASTFHPPTPILFKSIRLSRAIDRKGFKSTDFSISYSIIR